VDETVSRSLIAFVLAGVVACAVPDDPAHLGGYPFTDAAGDIFHWPADRTPVRFWADPRGNMNELVQNAIAVWQRQFMYGEFTGVIVSDSAHADVIFTWFDSVPPTVPPDNGAPVKACGGMTNTDSIGADSVIHGAFQSTIQILHVGATAGQTEACVRRTTIHEMGHALGILNDLAPDSTDIMYFTPLVPVPSAADRTTMQILYHTTPNLFPPVR
jgi:predicted Zn-dependent protease